MLLIVAWRVFVAATAISCAECAELLRLLGQVLLQRLAGGDEVTKGRCLVV